MTAEQLKRLLPSTADDGMATHILAACEKTDLPLSYALALVEKESGFRNVFGHDPTTSIPDRWKGTRVSWPKYRWYRARRSSKGMQGVGPCQLTWWEYQDAADKAGGCHKPFSNMVVAFGHLHALTKSHGKEKGAAQYNGAGDAAAAYGRDFVHKQAAWHARVA